MTIFHRKYNQRTQSIRTAIQQTRNKELWGRGAFGGLPAALAYFGALPASQEGTQFTCNVPYLRTITRGLAFQQTPFLTNSSNCPNYYSRAMLKNGCFAALSAKLKNGCFAALSAKLKNGCLATLSAKLKNELEKVATGHFFRF